MFVFQLTGEVFSFQYPFDLLIFDPVLSLEQPRCQTGICKRSLTRPRAAEVIKTNDLIDEPGSKLTNKSFSVEPPRTKIVEIRFSWRKPEFHSGTVCP